LGGGGLARWFGKGSLFQWLLCLAGFSERSLLLLTVPLVGEGVDLTALMRATRAETNRSLVLVQRRNTEMPGIK
jgi:hypothetical protein